jgi:hypothetical protein
MNQSHRTAQVQTHHAGPYPHAEAPSSAGAGTTPGNSATAPPLGRPPRWLSSACDLERSLARDGRQRDGGGDGPGRSWSAYVVLTNRAARCGGGRDDYRAGSPRAVSRRRKEVTRSGSAATAASRPHSGSSAPWMQGRARPFRGCQALGLIRGALTPAGIPKHTEVAPRGGVWGQEEAWRSVSSLLGNERR